MVNSKTKKNDIEKQLMLKKLKGNLSIQSLPSFVIVSIYSYLFSNESNQENEIKMIIDNILKPVDNKTKDEFNNYISSLNNDEIYDFLIYTTNNFDTFHEDSSSKELCELVLKLFGDLYGGPIMLDACSGSGRFIINAIDYSLKKHFVFKDLKGVDSNFQKVKLTNLAISCIYRLKQINDPGKMEIKISNSMTDYKNLFATHTYIFPPLNLKFSMKDNYYRSSLFNNIEFTGKNSAEWIFIDNVLSQSHDGIVIAITPIRALFSDSDEDYRKELLKHEMLEGIIELPQGAINYTNVKLSLLIFNTGFKAKNKSVKILDASDFYIKDKNNCNYLLDVEKIYKFYNSSNCVKKDINELINKKSLEPSKILLNLDDGILKLENPVELSKVATIFTGSQYTLRNFQDDFSNEKTGYKILTSSDINNGIIEWNNLHSIQCKDLKLNKYVLKKNDLIVTSKSSKVKIAVVDIEPKEKIIVTGGMIVVRPDIKKLNPTYLKMFLDSKIGQNLLKSIQKGNTIISLNAKDLATIQIPLINIETQNKKASTYNQKLREIWNYKKIIEKLEEEISNYLAE